MTALALAVGTRPAGPELSPPPALRAALELDQPWPRRLIERTQPLLGRPYAFSPLGEGFGQDPDPRLRFDRFDCTTLVETALVLVHDTGEAPLLSVMDAIRYDGPPTFETRRHLATSQWIPGLVAGGWLEDVSRPVGGDETKQVVLRLDRERWEKRRIARRLPLEADAVPEGRFVLDVVPLDVLVARRHLIPDGTVLNVVRVAWRRSPDLVTHQGLLIRDEQGRWRMRHASPLANKVLDEPLDKVLERYRKKRKWPIAGANLLRIVEPR